MSSSQRTSRDLLNRHSQSAPSGLHVRTSPPNSPSHSPPHSPPESSSLLLPLSEPLPQPLQHSSQYAYDNTHSNHLPHQQAQEFDLYNEPQQQPYRYSTYGIDMSPLQSPHPDLDLSHPNGTSPNNLRQQPNNSPFGTTRDSHHRDHSGITPNRYPPPIGDYERMFSSPLQPLVLQTLTTASTVLLTVLPVVLEDNKSWGVWYSWRDFIRLIEPFCSGLLHCWFFFSSDLMRPWIAPSIDGSEGEGGGASKESAIGGAVSGASGDISTHPSGKGNRPNGEYKQSEYVVNMDGNRRPSGGAGVGGAGGSSLANTTSYPPLPAADRNAVSPSPQQQHTASFTNRGNKVKAKSRQDVFRIVLAVVFALFFMLYLTGGAIHTAAAFFKNTIAFFLDQRSVGIALSTHAPTEGDGTLSLELAKQLKEGYLLMQDAWEHKISHYMYAVGALGMSWCEMIAYSRQKLPVGFSLARCGHAVVLDNGRKVVLVPKSSPEGQGIPNTRSRRLVAWWIAAGVLYGAIVAGVACQYPWGIKVGFVYIGALLVVISGYIVISDSRRHEPIGLFSIGKHYILQTYLMAGVIALAIIGIYIAIHKGSLLTSNDKSYLGSITRP
ncbi:hypothetical protein BGX34_004862 [Mortierella sp. NVP85]|nr:hypothetical protein BGX34_004862 [Mortierella sp. NVP85]